MLEQFRKIITRVLTTKHVQIRQRNIQPASWLQRRTRGYPSPQNRQGPATARFNLSALFLRIPCFLLHIQDLRKEGRRRREGVEEEKNGRQKERVWGSVREGRRLGVERADVMNKNDNNKLVVMRRPGRGPAASLIGPCCRWTPLPAWAEAAPVDCDSAAHSTIWHHIIHLTSMLMIKVHDRSSPLTQSSRSPVAHLFKLSSLALMLSCIQHPNRSHTFFRRACRSRSFLSANSSRSSRSMRAEAPIKLSKRTATLTWKCARKCAAKSRCASKNRALLLRRVDFKDE